MGQFSLRMLDGFGVSERDPDGGNVVLYGPAGHGRMVLHNIAEQ